LTCVCPPPRNIDRAGDRLRTGIQLVEGRDEVPDCFDTFAEYVEFCVEYRAKLAQIVKQTATWLPQQVRCLKPILAQPFVIYTVSADSHVTCVIL